MGVWDRIRDALGAMWAAVQGPDGDARTQLMAWLVEAWQAEQRLSRDLQHIATTVPYEQFRKELDAMAQDDEHHATLLHQHLETIESGPSVHRFVATISTNRHVGSPWRRVLGVLQDKRNLYERYRQEVVFLDNTPLQTLVQRIRDEEARHQEQLIEILTHLDAYVHETIT
jgi:bacterioferritin (cytochrome b1)